MKKFFKSKLGIFISSFLVSLLIKIIYKTGKWNIIKDKKAKDIQNNKKPYIAVFWHSRMVLMPFMKDYNQSFGMLGSDHGDSLIIQKAVSYFNITHISGSSTEGGREGLLEMKSWIKKSFPVGLTPDGPRGPAYELKMGVVQLARLLKVPIIPCTYSSKYGKFLNTWDCFLLPKLFDDGVLLLGEPIEVTKKDNMEESRLKVEESLFALTKQADELCGRLTPTPDPKKAEKALRKFAKQMEKQQEKNKKRSEKE